MPLEACYLIIYQPNGLWYKNFITPKNQLNFWSLLGYIWRFYSNMSVCIVGYDFDYGPSPWLCWGRLIRRDKNISGLDQMLSLLSSYVSETFEMFCEDSGSEDLNAY